MPQTERTGTRDLTYSAWHRANSISRFVSEEEAKALTLIDLDHVMWMECEDGSFEPIALIELARDVGQTFKTAEATRRLARRCHPTLPAYTVLYRVSMEANPRAPEHPDIVGFRVQQIWPNETKFFYFTPQQWAKKLVDIRTYGAGFLTGAEAANGRS